MNARRLSLFLILAMVSTLFSACTLIRERDPENGGGGNNGELVNTLEPRVIDVIILVDLPRGAANLMSGYTAFLAYIEAGLAVQNVAINRLAIAPLYRTQSSKPPLLYGRNDPHSPFSSLGESLDYYASNEGLAHLDGENDAEGESLAALGLNLNLESVFNPINTPTETVAYFDEASDGFVVFYLTASSRRCNHGSERCALNQMPPAQYFTEVDDDTGFASWLRLPGPTGHHPSRIMHISIATDEGIDFASFSSKCLREPHFPANHLDVIEPSEQYRFFGPLIADIKREGGNGLAVDFCGAFSSRANHSALHTAGQISRMLR